MAALVITATTVVGDLTNAVIYQIGTGVTVTAGQSVYVDTNNKVQLFDSNSVPTTVPTIFGVSLNGGSQNQCCAIQTKGNITIGATVVTGTMYIVGAVAAGDINPDADRVSTWVVIELGRASSASVIVLAPRYTGITV